MSAHHQASARRSALIWRASICLAVAASTAIRFAGRALVLRITLRPSSLQSLLGQSLAELCESLGTTYIKFGQLLSTRYDLFPPAILKPLERLQDQVAPLDSRDVPALLHEQLGCAPSDVFATLDSAPISSASVACVYRATLHTGQTVAVKIQRPGVVQRVHTDLQLMRWCAKLLVRIPALHAVPMVEVIDQLGEAIVHQLDFRREAENNRRFRTHFAHDHHIHLPTLIDEYCTDMILVMEFFPDLIRIDQLYAQGVNLRPALVAALRALYQMIFVDGFIHCDLHPGNMYFQAGGQVIFLDTGFVKTFSYHEQLLFAKFFFGIVNNQGQQCAKIMYETALSVPPTFRYAEFEQRVSDLIARINRVRAMDFQVAQFAMQLFDTQRRFGLRAAPNFVMAILALLVFEGIVKTYYPELDFQSEAMPFLIKALIPARPYQVLH